MKRVIMMALLAAVSVAVGCDRSHMSSSYGTSLRLAFHRQVIDPAAGLRAGREIQGLDPQEAAIVLDTYRRSLSPRNDADAARRSPVMLMTPPAPGAAPVTP